MIGLNHLIVKVPIGFTDILVNVNMRNGKSLSLSIGQRVFPDTMKQMAAITTMPKQT